ncbi:MAG TPA: STAS domain-containing protein [Tepidisphaeraceae bacterium]|nr:STAS domain-containing protein [Tepidisphaeraceae bacterium]
MFDDAPPSELIVRQHDDVTVVRINTEQLNGILEVQRVSAAIANVIDTSRWGKVILDLKRIRFFSSAGLGMLIEMTQRAKARGGKLVISHPEHVMPMIKVSRMDRLLNLADDPKAASKMF